MLFKKLLLFSLIIVIIEQLFNQSVIKKVLPAFWGNEEIAAKINYLNDHPDVNTVFIGSSKVKTQIIPAIFDSVTGGKTKSFNIGCNGLFIPESFKLVNYLLDNSKLKTILFEIRPIYHIYKENLHITRTIYYHTVSSYVKSLENAYHSNLPFVRKVNSYSTFSIAEIENLLNFNLAEGIINYKNFDFEQLYKYYSSNGGCFIMGEEPSQALLDNHNELDNRAALSIFYMKQWKNDTLLRFNYNKIYLSEMQRLITKAKQKNIQFVLIFPTALREFEYKEILPLLRQLQGTPQFLMADALTFPELYDVKNNFETDHLNGKGAGLYSIDLGKEFNKFF